MQYLMFLVFAYSDDQKSRLLTLSTADEDKMKTQRALSVLKRVMSEQALTEDDLQAIQLGPIDRNITLYEYSLSYIRQQQQQSGQLGNSSSTQRPSSDADAMDDTKSDMKLLMSASSAARSKYEQLS